MSSIKVSLCLVVALTIHTAEAQYIPPDYYGDTASVGRCLVPNVGQVRSIAGGSAPEVVAYTMGTAPQMFMMKDSKMKVVWRDLDTLDATPDPVYSIAVNLVGEGVDLVDPVTVLEREHYYNFYLPQCPSGGLEYVHGYSRAVYEDVYPEIDMHVYSGSMGMKIAFVIHPNGHPTDLQLRFEGQDSIKIDYMGTLRAYLAERSIELPEAVAYQVDSAGSIIPVGWTANYTVDENSGVAGFECGSYDNRLPLVLQIGPPPLGGGTITTPGVCWGSYWCGDAQGYTTAAAIDNPESFIENQLFAGKTFTEFLAFPPDNGTGQTYAMGSESLFISRFRDLVVLGEPRWTDYYGASGGLQYAHGLAVDESHNVYMVGTCSGTDLYTWHPGNEFFSPTSRGGFIARFDYYGVIQWATHFNECYGAAIDNGRLVVTGQTIATNLFEPTTQPSGATYYPHTSGHANDAFIAKFTEANELWWSSYLGGAKWEMGRQIAAAGGQIVVSGVTNSYTMPCVMSGGSGAYNQSVNASSNDTWDAWLVRFSSAGVQNWGTFWGGTGGENPWGYNMLAVHPSTGDIYFTGSSDSEDIPNVPGNNWSTPTSTITGNKGFIAQFDGTTLELVYSTHLGDQGSYPSFTPYTLTISDEGDLFVGGSVGSTTVIDAQPYPDLYYSPQPTNTRDGFILWLSPEKFLRWYTRTGGEDHGLETLTSLAYSNTHHILYAFGSTDADFSTGDFFPLTELASPSYFSALGSDIAAPYILAFCIEEPSVGVEQNVKPEIVIASTSVNGYITISGLTAGTHVVEVYDLQGRLIEQVSFQCQGGRGAVRCGSLNTATYVLRLDGTTQLVYVENF